MHVKDEARMIGFDDGPFTFDEETCALAGVMTRGGGYVEAVLVDEVTVDGRDATDTVIELSADSSLLETAQAIAFEGGTVAGFNVLDLERLHAELGVPVLALTRQQPDRQAVRDALEAHVSDPEARARLLEAQPMRSIELGDDEVYMRHAGGDPDRLAELLRTQTVRGSTPEPVRIARLVARAVARGTSTAGADAEREPR